MHTFIQAFVLDTMTIRVPTKMIPYIYIYTLHIKIKKTYMHTFVHAFVLDTMTIRVPTKTITCIYIYTLHI